MAQEPASTLNPQGGPRRDGAWAEQLVDEILLTWQNTEPSAEETFALYPDLLSHPEAAVRLVYEEVCQRRAAGEEISPEVVCRRFPQWRTQLELVLRLHSLLDLDAPPPDWPTPGKTLGDFRLLTELGRGALGRVFLATQSGLADRAVVLKLTPCSGQEHLSLARLQHTHVVPLYTAYEDEARNLRVLCMPYFGGATLHDLLRALRDTPPGARTGQHLLDGLDRLQARWPLAPAARGPARDMLARLSYTQAVCWVGACLADALHYAHDRGLVHLDVKPSNVLLAADGQPMLLDFHIAQGPVRPNGPAPERLGGTPAYAAPEQRAALEAVKRGAAVPGLVDGRADLYALGLLLYEALHGHLPPDKAAPPRPADVSPGLADILARCLAARPAERYATGAALADDLRRHLNHFPLRGVPNRSLRERWRKWRLRRPSALNLTVMAVAVLAAAVALGTYVLGHLRHEYHEAEAALAEGRRQLRAQAYGEALSTLRHGLTLAEGLPGGDELRARFRRELRLAGRARVARQLHTLADRLRFLCGGAPSSGEGGLASLGTAFRAVWDRRGALLERAGAELSPEAEEQVRGDLLDLGVVWADVSVRLAGPAERAAHAHEALKVLADAEAQFGASVPLCRQREICAAALGQKDAASAAGRCAAELPLRSPWEHYALGRSLLQDGALEQAAVALNRAVELQPQAFWPHFHRGVCAHRLGHLHEAASAFEVCVALASDKAECYYNRGLVRVALGQPESALHDYTEALRLNPRMGAAALNRGLLHYARKRYLEAAADLDRALASGANPATVHYNLALVHLARRQRADARASLELALRADPRHAAALRLRASLQSGEEE